MSEVEKKEIVWERIRTETGPDLTLFKIRYDWMRNPRNHHTVKAIILESQDWVNIVPITPEGNIVVVRQYRFGTEDVAAENIKKDLTGLIRRRHAEGMTMPGQAGLTRSIPKGLIK